MIFPACYPVLFQEGNEKGIPFYLLKKELSAWYFEAQKFKSIDNVKDFVSSL